MHGTSVFSENCYQNSFNKTRYVNPEDLKTNSIRILKSFLKLYLFLILSLPFTLSSQHYYQKSIGENFGIVDNAIIDIEITEDGYVWFINDGSLVRFDGVKITKYKPESSIRQASNTKIKVLKDGRLMFNGQEKYYIFDRAGERFSSFSNKLQTDYGYEMDNFGQMHEVVQIVTTSDFDVNGNLLIAKSDSLYIVNEDGQFNVWTDTTRLCAKIKKYLIENKLGSYPVKKAILDDNNTVFLVIGTYVVWIKNGEISHFNSWLNDVSQIDQSDDKNHFWVQTKKSYRYWNHMQYLVDVKDGVIDSVEASDYLPKGNSLYYYDLNENKLIKRIDKKNVVLFDSVPNTYSRGVNTTLLNLDSNRIMIVNKSHLIIYDEGTSTSFPIAHHNTFTDHQFKIDREGNIWGYGRSGLSILIPSATEYIGQGLFKNAKEKGWRIKGVDHEDNIWYFSSTTDISIYNPRSGISKLLDIDKSLNITSERWANSENLFVDTIAQKTFMHLAIKSDSPGSARDQLFVYDGNELTPFDIDPSSIEKQWLHDWQLHQKGNTIYAIKKNSYNTNTSLAYDKSYCYEYVSGDWVQTYTDFEDIKYFKGHVALLYESDSGGIKINIVCKHDEFSKEISFDGEKIPDLDNISGIDQDHNLWSVEEQKIQCLNLDSQAFLGLEHSGIKKYVTDTRNGFWAIKENGLAYYKILDDSIIETLFSIKTILDWSNVYSLFIEDNKLVVIDKKHRIAIDLNLFHKTGKIVVNNLSKFDNLYSRLKSGDNIYLFNNYSILKLDLSRNEPYPIKYISNFKTDVLDPVSGEKTSYTNDEIELSYEENELSFNFKSIYHRNPENITYSYKLEGYNESWVKTESEKVTFTSLKPGKYAFIVKACSDDNCSPEKKIQVIINPPFYFSWWFIALCIFIFSAILYAFYKARVKVLKKRQIQLEGQIKTAIAEISEQKDEIEEQNRDIKESISYARRIQEAILPPTKLVKEYLTESFILYKPKDIVAGDFYWFDVQGDEIYFAAADCTGHGVPGAMVSVICANALNKAVNELKISETAAILDQVRELVVQTFEKSEDEVKDGMDISFCKLNLKTRVLSYSGAHNPLYRITKKPEKVDDNAITTDTHILLEYKGDKQPIGKFSHEKPFTQKEIQLLEGDVIYLSSDGYPDQFGGPKGKKFMYKPLKKLLISISQEDLNNQRNTLLKKFDTWKGSNEQVDDVCMIGVRV